MDKFKPFPLSADKKVDAQRNLYYSMFNYNIALGIMGKWMNRRSPITDSPIERLKEISTWIYENAAECPARKGGDEWHP